MGFDTIEINLVYISFDVTNSFWPNGTLYFGTVAFCTRKMKNNFKNENDL